MGITSKRAVSAGAITAAGGAVTSGTLAQFAATTSAQLRGIISDVSGGGALVFAGGALGAATATTINKVALTQPATGSTLTIADGKTLTASNSVIFTAVDGSTLAIGAGGTLGSNAYTSTAYATAASPTLTGTTTAANLTTSGAVADSGYSYQTPSTGFTITMGNAVYHLVLDPAGTLTTGTITMCAAPVDGQMVDIKISQIITTLTVAGNSGQLVKGNPTSAAVGSSFTGIYRATNTTWYF